MTRTQKRLFVLLSLVCLSAALFLIAAFRPAPVTVKGNPLIFDGSEPATMPEVSNVFIPGEERRAAPEPRDFVVAAQTGPQVEVAGYTPRDPVPMPGYVDQAPQPMPGYMARDPQPLPGSPIATPPPTPAATAVVEDRRPD